MNWETLKEEAKRAGYLVTDDGLMITFENPCDPVDQGSFYQDATRGAFTALAAAQQWLAQRNIDVNRPESGPKPLKLSPRDIVLCVLVRPLVIMAVAAFLEITFLHWSLAMILAATATGYAISMVILLAMVVGARFVLGSRVIITRGERK